MRLHVTRESSSPHTRVIFWLSLVCAALLFTVTQELLNVHINYTISGGSFAEKFHPATYAAALLLLVILAEATSSRVVVERIRLAHVLMFSALVGVLALLGKGAFAAVITDIFVTPAILLLGLSRCSTRDTERLVGLFVWIAAANAVVILAEFASQQTLLPVDRNEAFFRPGGFMGHPIVAGTIGYCALFLVTNQIARVPIHRTLTMLLIAGVACCGVRGPLAAVAVILTGAAVKARSHRRNIFARAADFGTALVLPMVVLAAYWVGALDRVISVGVWEESAQSRFLVFDVANLLTSGELLYGVNYDVADAVVRDAIGTNAVENFAVTALLIAGAPFALAFTVAIILFYWPAIRTSRMFAFMFVIVALTTLGFGAKNTIPAAMAMTGYACIRLKTRSRIDAVGFAGTQCQRPLTSAETSTQQLARAARTQTSHRGIGQAAEYHHGQL